MIFLFYLVDAASTIYKSATTLFRATGPRERFAIAPCIGRPSRDSRARDLWTYRRTFVAVSGTFLPHFLCSLQYLWTESETLRLRKSCHINKIRASTLFAYREGVPTGVPQNRCLGPFLEPQVHIFFAIPL